MKSLLLLEYIGTTRIFSFFFVFCSINKLRHDLRLNFRAFFCGWATCSLVKAAVTVAVPNTKCMDIFSSIRSNRPYTAVIK